MASVPAPLQMALTRLGSDGLRAHVTGARSLENTIAYWSAIAERAAEQPPRWLVVVDELVGVELSPAQWNDLVQSMLGRGLERVRIAHVKTFGLDDIEYCEFYAGLAGFEARAFHTEPEALRWLRYGSEGPDAPLFKWAAR